MNTNMISPEPPEDESPDPAGPPPVGPGQGPGGSIRHRHKKTGGS